MTVRDACSTTSSLTCHAQTRNSDQVADFLYADIVCQHGTPAEVVSKQCGDLKGIPRTYWTGCASTTYLLLRLCSASQWSMHNLSKWSWECPCILHPDCLLPSQVCHVVTQCLHTRSKQPAGANHDISTCHGVTQRLHTRNQQPAGSSQDISAFITHRSHHSLKQCYVVCWQT